MTHAAAADRDDEKSKGEMSDDQ